MPFGDCPGLSGYEFVAIKADRKPDRPPNVTPPKLQAISDRIEEMLLQRQVSNLLADWLKSLRAQGTVRTIQPGEASP